MKVMVLLLTHEPEGGGTFPLHIESESFVPEVAYEYKKRFVLFADWNGPVFVGGDCG